MVKKEKNQTIKNVIIPIIWIIVGLIIGGIYDYLKEKPDIDIIMPTELEDNHLPIILDNIGDKIITNITIRVNSCDMDFNKSYFVEELKKGQKHTITFDEEKTIEQSKKLPCYDIMKVNLTKYKIWVKTYKHNMTNRVVFPYQNYTIDMCMHCYWDIYFYSDQLNKTFREETYSTGQMTYTFGDKDKSLPPEYVPFEPIAISFYDDRIIKAYS